MARMTLRVGLLGSLAFQALEVVVQAFFGQQTGDEVSVLTLVPLPDGGAVAAAHLGHDLTLLEATATVGLGWLEPEAFAQARFAGFSAQAPARSTNSCVREPSGEAFIELATGGFNEEPLAGTSLKTFGRYKVGGLLN